MAVLSLPYPISANQYWRKFNGRVVVSQQAREYKNLAAFTALSEGVKPMLGKISLSVLLHPKLTKKGKASETRMDLDNALKVLIDSLIGVAYFDDSQIHKIAAEIAAPVQGGGVTITVERYESDIPTHTL